MKRLQKSLAVFLAALLLFSVAAFSGTAQGVQKNYVVLGDSIGWGAGVLNHDDACFGRIVADTNGYRFTNLAHNGDRSENLLEKLQRSSVSEAVGAADIISISIGGNDFLTSNLPLLVLEGTFGQYKRFNTIGAAYRANFEKIIERILTLNPDVQILMQTLYNPGNFLVRKAYQQATNRINGTIREYLDAHPGAYAIVDVAAAFGSNMSYIAADSIHPSAKGNVKIAELTLQKLYELGLGAQTAPVVQHEGIDQVSFSATGIRGHFQLIFKAIRRMFGA